MIATTVDATERTARISTRSVDHIAFNVPDLDAALAFFTVALGCEMVGRQGPAAWGNGLTVTSALVRYDRHAQFELLEWHGASVQPAMAGLHDPGGGHLAFAVADLDGAIIAAEALLRVPIAAPRQLPDGRRATWFSTPWGMTIQLLTRLSPATDEDANAAMVRLWSDELWSKGNLAVADDIVAPDYVRHDPGDPFPARGPEDVKRLVGSLRAMLPDLSISIDDIVAAGDRVVVRYTATATDSVGFMGHPATGRAIHTSAIQIFRFQGGRIAESWAVRDDLGMLRQLGHVPSDLTR